MHASAVEGSQRAPIIQRSCRNWSGGGRSLEALSGDEEGWRRTHAVSPRGLAVRPRAGAAAVLAVAGAEAGPVEPQLTRVSLEQGGRVAAGRITTEPSPPRRAKRGPLLDAQR